MPEGGHKGRPYRKARNGTGPKGGRKGRPYGFFAEASLRFQSDSKLSHSMKSPWS